MLSYFSFFLIRSSYFELAQHNIYKKCINSICLIIVSICFAQNTPRSHKIFTIDHGFEVESVTSMFFDTNGWLWISGSFVANQHKVLNQAPIIQRFNGSTFQKILLPDFKNEELAKAQIKKRKDEKIYVLFSGNTNFKLYLLNPSLMDYQEVDISNIIYHNHLIDINLLPYKESFLIFGNNKKESFIYILDNNLNITLFNKIPHIKNMYVNRLVEFEDHFIINDERNGVHSFNNKGHFLSTITTKDLNIAKKNIDYIINIGSSFPYDGNYYSSFSINKENYYQYNTNKRLWEKTNLFQKEGAHTIYNQFINDSKGNILKLNRLENEMQLFRYLKNKNTIPSPYHFNIKGVPVGISRDLEKEFFLTAKGELHHIVFENPNFSIFLKDHSIRGILPINDDDVLVASEANGWYTINLKTKETKPFRTTLKGKSYIATENKGIFYTGDGYWSNYDKGIVYIDNKTKELTSYIHFPIATMVNTDTSIYYGTYYYNLMRFDKATKKHIILAKTDTLNIQSIIKVKNKIYGTTNSGLLIYSEKETKVLQPSNEPNDNFLLSIGYSKKYGLLVGSRSGKLYQYDMHTKSFKVLYQDAIKASITTFLFDQQNRIWLNTFSGIVSFDPKTKKTTRYNESNGLSYYETNRYSAAKTKDGFFLVGTLKGLNYFHPDSLSKSNLKVSLKLLTLKYYDKNHKKEIVELTSNKLDNLKTIILPANNRYFSLQFGLLGLYLNETISYQYRLNKDPWNNLNRKNELELINLSPGNYTLEIKALDSSLQKIGNSLLFSIKSKDFFYNSIWFYLLILFLLILLGYAYILQFKKRHHLKEQFSDQLIHTQENERSRIAKELHDSIGQKLLVLKNTWITRGTSKNNNLPLIEDTIKEVREMSHNLHPFQFEKLGLITSLENTIATFQKSSATFYSIDIDVIEGLITKNKEIFVFRMLQECISNVEKHAKATACNVLVKKGKDEVLFQVKDNGKGFLFNREQTGNGLGMRTLKERAAFIDAQLKIYSEKGKGTIVQIKIKKK